MDKDILKLYLFIALKNLLKHVPIWLIATEAPNWYVNKLAAELSNKGDDKLFKTLSLLIPEEELKPELKSIKGGYKDIDVVTVSEQLNQKGILEDVGGVTYLTQLAGSVPTTANTIYYCDLVKSKALRRRGIEAAKNIRYLSEVQEFEYDETFLTEVENQALKIRSMAFSLLASTLGSFSKMYIKYW